MTHEICTHNWRLMLLSGVISSAAVPFDPFKPPSATIVALLLCSYRYDRLRSLCPFGCLRARCSFGFCPFGRLVAPLDPLPPPPARCSFDPPSPRLRDAAPSQCVPLVSALYPFTCLAPGRILISLLILCVFQLSQTK